MKDTQAPTTPDVAEQTAAPEQEQRYVAPKRRRRLGDRKDGRRLRTIQPMSRLSRISYRRRGRLVCAGLRAESLYRPLQAGNGHYNGARLLAFAHLACKNHRHVFYRQRAY